MDTPWIGSIADAISVRAALPEAVARALSHIEARGQDWHISPVTAAVRRALRAVEAVLTDSA